MIKLPPFITRLFNRPTPKPKLVSNGTQKIDRKRVKPPQPTIVSATLARSLMYKADHGLIAPLHDLDVVVPDIIYGPKVQLPDGSWVQGDKLDPQPYHGGVR